MLIESKKDGLLMIPKLAPNGVSLGTLTLLQGVNKVSDEDWELVRSLVKDKIDRKIIIEKHAEIKVTEESVIDEETGEPVKDKKTGKEKKVKKTKVVKSKDLKDLSAEAALEIVKETYDLKTLNDWINNGKIGKDEVRAAVRDQIELVESYGEDKKSADAHKEDK